MDTLELAKKIAAEALETKAKDLRLLDLQNLVSYTDYFLLGTGTSDRQVRAIADRVHHKIKKDLGRLPLSYEGQGAGGWVLLDYGDVVLHLFLEDQRRYYGLDELWADAPELPIEGVLPVKRPAKKPAKKTAAAKRAKKPAPGKSPKKPAKAKAKTKAPAKKKKK